ncbi:MAG: phospholipase [Alphaproteobacteria bacterium]|nr:phospholipase [Alphaproteobacteria bacterium]
MLDGPRLPAESGDAKELVILLHGLGADGNDLIGLAEHWVESFPDTEFVSPHAPEACDMAPQGRQWFSLRDRNPESTLAGAQRAHVVLDRFIDAELKRLGLGPERLGLVGFSQGTMMALYTGLRRPTAPAAIVGFSGALVAPERLVSELAARPPVLLIHGDKDEIVPVGALHGSVAGLSAAGVAVAWHISPGMGHSIDETGLALGGDFLVRCLTGRGRPQAPERLAAR